MSQTPGYVPPGTPIHAVPFEDLLKASSGQGALDILTEHTQQPSSRVSQTPGYVPLGDPTRTVPFEDLLRASSGQGVPDVVTEHFQHPGSRMSQTPGYVPPGDPTRTVPFEDLPRASSKQDALDVPMEHVQQRGGPRLQTPGYVPLADQTLAAPFEHDLGMLSRQRSVPRHDGIPFFTEDDTVGKRPGRDDAVAIPEDTHLETPRAGRLPLRTPDHNAKRSPSPISSTSSSLRSVNIPDGALDALDVQITEICNATGLRVGDIINHLGLRDVQAVDFFDMYRSYFASQVGEELKRVPGLELAEASNADSDDEISDSVIEKAFEQFKEANPQYKSFLLDRWSISRIADQIGHRGDQFQEFTKKLEFICTFASEFLQFETAACAVGSDIHKDQNLSATICSPMVSEVSLTHGSDCVSKRSQPKIPPCLQDRRELSQTISSDDGSHVVPTEMETAKGANRHAHSVADSRFVTPSIQEIRATRCQSVDPAQGKKVKDGAVVQELKQRLLELTEPCNIEQLKKKIYLTKLPMMLSKQGWIIENWPEEVPFACDCHTGKGVAGLSVDEQIALLKSLKDPNFPLRIVRKSTTAIPQSEPVIIGVPPSPDSQFTHGRRRFLDAEKTCDRNGPPRLTALAIQPSAARPLEVPDKSRPEDIDQSNIRKRSASRNDIEKQVEAERQMVFESRTPNQDGSLASHKPEYDLSGTGLQTEVPSVFGLKIISAGLWFIQIHKTQADLVSSLPGVVDSETDTQLLHCEVHRAAGTQPAIAVQKQSPCLPDVMSVQASAGYWPQPQPGGSFTYGLPSGNQVLGSATPHADNAGSSHQCGVSGALPFVRLNGSQPSNQFLQASWPSYPSHMPRQSQSPGNSENAIHNYQMGAQYGIGSGTYNVDETRR
ncbi:hypothetical protein CVT26_004884 [Gymnopilus dilepis]|uniref:Uncharacterized protein n=1 Tax=Gymnopilus dilepis TaxID=231916 RepID=A0A409W8G5_9AGAR|nr:hypothetical protein CVT26_004884 [Gymnopilus dilepis]